MAKPPASSSGRGRPPRSSSGSGSGSGAGSGSGKGRAPSRTRKSTTSSSRGDRPSEGPPWKRRQADADKLKEAGWGGVARKGAGRMRDTGRGDASKAFRAAAPEGRVPWVPEEWIDEGEVRGEASRAVGRGRTAAGKQAPSGARRRSSADADVAQDPSLGKAVGGRSIEKAEQRLREASRAFKRERFEDARKILRPLAEAAPTAESVRELLGLTYYRLGRWKAAAAELEAFRGLSGSTEQHPVLADCYRALGRHAKVAELWEELRAASPSAALVAEGRIVAAGALADQGRLDDAIRLLAAAKLPTKRPKEHHLRVGYALADLYERAGDIPRARQLFGVVAAADPDLGDVTARLRALR